MNIKSILIALCLSLVATLALEAQSTYKCTIQMKSYEGREAYVVASLVDAKGEHVQTLHVLGPNRRWYTSLEKWYKAWRSKREKTDAVTGASIAAGDRQAFAITLNQAHIDKGYQIRFDSSVEDQKTYEGDVVIPVTTNELTKRAEGKGYIRLVKLSKSE